MILDDLDNFHQYVEVHPAFKIVEKFLTNNNLLNIEVGMYQIAPDVYLNIDLATGKSLNAAVLESHQLMIDIQITLTNEELMGYCNKKGTAPAIYEKDKDISFHEETPSQYVHVKPGYFVIFFPQDLHAPCISDKKQIRKAVFKVKI